MARENVELVQSVCSAWGRGDYSSIEWAHPEIEFVIADGPSPGKWTGLAGMAEGWRTWLGAWDDFHQEADEYRELDGERVLVFSAAAGAARRVDWSSPRCTIAAPVCSTFKFAR